MEISNKQHPLKMLSHFWDNNTNSIWLATTLLLHRNIDKFSFPQRLETAKKKELTHLVFSTIKELELLEQPTILLSESIQAIERDFLYEHFLQFEPLKDSLLGQSFLFDASGSFLIKANVQDHLQFCGLDRQGHLEKTFERLQSIERALERKIAFAFSDKFGYLTEDPALCGTGLIAKAYLHVPALIETEELHSYLENCNSEGVSITGLHGTSDEITGDMIVVQNRWTIGTTEASILSLLRTTALAIASHEKEMRTKLHETPQRDESIFDRISRMVGTLKYSQTMDTSEALFALSLAKLGLEVGWLAGISIEELNRQFFELRRAHIAATLGWHSTKQNIDHERASRLRTLFTNVQIVR